LAAAKDFFKAGLQNREDNGPLKASSQRRDSRLSFDSRRSARTLERQLEKARSCG
jgi:hypothetical protein